MRRLKIDALHWGDAGIASAVQSAVACPKAVLLKHVFDSSSCSKVVNAIKEDEPTPILKPLRGENTVSYARNKWTRRLHEPRRLLIGQGAEGSVRGQARLDLEPCFQPDQMPPQLLGGHELNVSDSAIFVTSEGLRTGLHSDERHGMLLQLSGRKNFVLIPPEDSDADPRTLRKLLQLRGTSGKHDKLYGEQSRNVALRKVRLLYGTLETGDALFIPQRWLHDIESVESTISISLRFGNWDEPN